MKLKTTDNKEKSFFNEGLYEKIERKVERFKKRQ